MSQRMRRLVIQALILVSQVVVAVVSGDLYTLLIAGSIVLSVPITWVAAGILLWASQQGPEITSLADAADNLVTVAINTTIAATLAVAIILRALGFISFPVALAVTVGLGYIITTNTLPAFRALGTWRDVWAPMVARRGRTED